MARTEKGGNTGKLKRNIQKRFAQGASEFMLRAPKKTNCLRVHKLGGPVRLQVSACRLSDRTRSGQAALQQQIRRENAGCKSKRSLGCSKGLACVWKTNIPKEKGGDTAGTTVRAPTKTTVRSDGPKHLLKLDALVWLVPFMPRSALKLPRPHRTFLRSFFSHMAMGQNPVPPVNIPTPTKMD